MQAQYSAARRKNVLMVTRARLRKKCEKAGIDWRTIELPAKKVPEPKFVTVDFKRAA